MKVAHAAGQYQSLMDMAELYPYWRYCTQDDERVRGSHKALDNKVFRYDDPFWDTHYPPNGWNCRCYVRAMDEDDLEDEGLSVTDSRMLKRSGFVGTDSGRVQTAYDVDGTTVPTEDGWNYNPGRIEKQLEQVVDKKTAGYEPELAAQVKADTEHYQEKQATTVVKARENKPITTSINNNEAKNNNYSPEELSKLSHEQLIQLHKSPEFNQSPKILTKEQYSQWLPQAQELGGNYWDKAKMRTKDDQSLTAKLAMKQLGNQVVFGDWPRHIQRVLEEKYNVKSGRHLIVDTANTINHMTKEKCSSSLSPERAQWVLENIHDIIQKAFYTKSPYGGVFYEKGKHKGDIVLLIPDEDFSLKNKQDKSRKQIIKIIIHPNYDQHGTTIIRTTCHIPPHAVDESLKNKSWLGIS